MLLVAEYDAAEEKSAGNDAVADEERDNEGECAHKPAKGDSEAVLLGEAKRKEDQSKGGRKIGKRDGQEQDEG